MGDRHAKTCSPSGAEGWFACAGRIVMEAPFPDEGSTYSDDGTARHAVCAKHLLDGTPVSKSIGVHQTVRPGVTVPYKKDWVDEDQDYVDTVRHLVGSLGELFVEREVNFERYTQVPDDSYGTADAIVLVPLLGAGMLASYELVVVDRKTGHGEVSPVRNKQLMLYALGALAEFGLAYDITRVRLVIHQRRAVEWDCSIEELLAFGEEARGKAALVQGAIKAHAVMPIADWQRIYLNESPSEDACRYCKAIPVCPSYNAAVQAAVGCDFECLVNLSSAEDRTAYATPTSDEQRDLKMLAVPLVEDWCKAMRADMERHLLAGGASSTHKLVAGKAGARQWTDTEAAEALLKSMRLKQEQMYDFKVISPTSAEKLAPKFDKDGKVKPGQVETPLGARQWAKLQPLIKRAEPQPSVAPVTDPRAPWTPPPADEDFAPVSPEPVATAPVLDLC